MVWIITASFIKITKSSMYTISCSKKKSKLYDIILSII